MTSTIKRRPRGYRTGISREVFEFVMKLLRDTLGTTGRYLDLMRRNAPLRIQGPKYQIRPYYDWSDSTAWFTAPRQFYRYDNRILPVRSFTPLPLYTAWQCLGWSYRSRRATGAHHIRHLEYMPISHLFRKSDQGSLVPFRHTYNASRII